MGESTKTRLDRAADLLLDKLLSSSTVNIDLDGIASALNTVLSLRLGLYGPLADQELLAGPKTDPKLSNTA